MAYKVWRLWWDPLYANSVGGSSMQYAANKIRPTFYTCKARTEKEAMRWGEAFFFRTGVDGGIRMFVDDGAMLVSLLVDDNERLRKNAKRILAEIQARDKDA